jgi:hypothetical protein
MMSELIHIGPTGVMVEALRRAMESDHPLAKDITHEVVATVTTCCKIRRPIPRASRARVIRMLSELRNLELMELPLFAHAAKPKEGSNRSTGTP